MKNHHLHCAICLSAWALWSAGSLAGDLTVTVEGARAGDGPVVLSLFDTPSGFPAGQARVAQSLAPEQGQVTFTFKDLPAGRYALSAFQDRNRNQRLDVSMMGMPTEPYGFSRDARSHAGPPKFDSAALKLDAAPMAIRFQLQ